MAAILLAGCGGATTTVIEQGPPAQSTASGGAAGTTATATSATTTTTASGTATTSGQAATRIVHLETFQTPTGNIGCMIVGGAARCDIVRRSWPLPPRPASCPSIVNFGQGLEVASAGAGRLVCAGDTALDPAGARLPYGTASRVGPYECVSRATGMTCTDRLSGHGFMLSVQRYRLF